jgi:DNA-directed RNA polymerase
MAWLKKSAGVILDSGKTEINWTTPSGFEVNQDLKKPNTVRIRSRIMGGAEIDVALADGFTAEPDRAHHKSAIAPNVVHALDASLLHLTFAFWDKPFTVIHDCVMARSCDVDATGKELRLHFGEMYKAPVMQQWADQVGVVLPDDLIKNTLDIDLVNQSTYFFS